MASTASDQSQNGHGHDHILRPRAVKPGNPQVLRAQSEDQGLRPNGATDILLSVTSRFVLFSRGGIKDG